MTDSIKGDEPTDHIEDETGGLPGMWERADFEGGAPPEHRGPDWKRSDVESYGDRVEVEVSGPEVVHGAELPAGEDPNDDSDPRGDWPDADPVFKQGGVRSGTFSSAMGALPNLTLPDEAGDGLEVPRPDDDLHVHRQDFTEVLTPAPTTNSVSITLWTGSRCTTLDQTWEQDDPQGSHLDALRALVTQAEQLCEDDRL